MGNSRVKHIFYGLIFLMTIFTFIYCTHKIEYALTMTRIVDQETIQMAIEKYQMETMLNNSKHIQAQNQLYDSEDARNNEKQSSTVDTSGD